NQFDPEDHKNSATTLFNGMIHPMLGFNIRGVVWYQGESNRYNPGIYKDMMVEMVKGWRAKWGIGEFPFYYCQIAPYKYTNEVNTAFLREAQLEASKEIPNSGMACLLDAGDENYIHPSKKRIAGERLAYLALKNTYGISGIHAEGPKFVEMKIDSSSVELTFDKDLSSFGRDLKLFELAGEDKKFYPAQAVILRRNKIVATSEDVLKPVAARYGFKNFVQGDLFDLYGLPASSFRTDDWEAETGL
ncbi:sialate O-acetylesterase, partial [Reichenbachiella sp.]|uniref:sialate O-acetylesterase n=1 Tax=Reichenbachiella sp. TaxID=2184521 RepID=UPI0032667BD2